MTVITTRTGRRFDLLSPKPSMVCIEDVAWQLSLINRYNGATVRPYSVAEHALLVAEIIERSTPGVHPIVLRAALHHDSHEAYVGDVTSPAKEALGATWAGFERAAMRAVRSHFGIDGDCIGHAHTIYRADLVARATEVRDLMADHPACWPELEGIEPVDWIDLRSRDGMDWMDWRRAFAERHEEIAAMLEARAA